MEQQIARLPRKVNDHETWMQHYKQYRAADTDGFTILVLRDLRVWFADLCSVQFQLACTHTLFMHIHHSTMHNEVPQNGAIKSRNLALRRIHPYSWVPSLLWSGLLHAFKNSFSVSPGIPCHLLPSSYLLSNHWNREVYATRLFVKTAFKKIAISLAVISFSFSKSVAASNCTGGSAPFTFSRWFWEGAPLPSYIFNKPLCECWQVLIS